MHYLCLFDFFRDLGMALKTEVFPLCGEQLLILSAVRVMAGSTPAEQGRMHCLFLHLLLHIKMAGEAQFRAIF